jgi:hypothetical protein
MEEFTVSKQVSEVGLEISELLPDSGGSHADFEPDMCNAILDAPSSICVLNAICTGNVILPKVIANGGTRYTAHGRLPEAPRYSLLERLRHEDAPSGDAVEGREPEFVRVERSVIVIPAPARGAS